MRVHTFSDRGALAAAAATEAAARIRGAIATFGRARIVVATGTSQLAFLEALIATPGIEWSQIELFHLDEYIGLPIDHPASFRKYLLERLIRPAGIVRTHLIDGEQNPADVCRALGRELTMAPVDVAFVGIGENGHLAFNDPPANFATEEPYLVVRLDEACRRQQLGEGWFDRLEDVRKEAISMSIRKILKAGGIVLLVHDERICKAVAAC